MAGFDNEVLYADNVDFRGVQPVVAQVTADGELLIGAGTSPNIRVNTLTPGPGVTIINAPGSITIGVTGVGQTITGDDALALSPTAGNWNILGQQAGTVPVMETDGTAPSTLRVEDRTWITKHVVDPSATVGLRGTYTTIAAAMTAAASGETVYVRPGTYVENLTAKAGVSVIALDIGGLTPIIQGQISCNMAAGAVSVWSGLRIETDGDHAVSFTGANQNFLTFKDCLLVATDNDLIEHTNSSATSILTIDNSLLDRLGNFAYFTSSATGFLQLIYTRFSNAALSTTASTMSAGFLRSFFSEFRGPITTSGTNDLLIQNTIMRMDNIDVTALTVGGSATNKVEGCEFRSGTTACVSVGSTLTMTDCSFDSTEASGNAISGAGTLLHSGLSFSNTANVINITAANQTGRVFRPGTMRSTTQPAFSAFLPSTVTNVTGAGAAFVIGTGTALTEIFDQASNFNTNGTFIAPVTGRYQFNAVVYCTGATVATTFLLEIVTNARTYQYEFNRAASAAPQSCTLSVLADMAATNTATVRITVSGEAGNTVDILGSANYPTGFSGFLVC
jgi:hypothetical protein